MPGRHPQNEGEGSRSAARAYNKKTEEHAKSGRSEQAGKQAKQAMEGPEGSKLRQAEKAGKAKSRGEDSSSRKH